MMKGKHVERTYLEALKEARTSGADDYEAADVAEAETIRVHGKMPKEKKR
jgi:hypothetical protein